MRYILIVLLTFFLVGCERETVVVEKMRIASNTKIGIFSTDGKVLVPPIYDNAYVIEGRDNFFITIDTQTTAKFGVLNANGTFLIEPIYQYMSVSNDGKYIIYSNNFTSFGLMDFEKKIIFEPSPNLLTFTPDG
ncbi:MAG: WG repeat-containing protein, partial [Campylobacteraceae bacterium]